MELVLACVLVVAALPALQALYRALYWTLRRDAAGRAVRLAPPVRLFSAVLIRNIARHNKQGDEMSYIAGVIAESAAMPTQKHPPQQRIGSTPAVAQAATCRVAAFFNDHAAILTSDPEVVAWILARNFDNYVKGQRFTELFQDFLGTGIFNSNGRVWKSHREIAKPHFLRDELQSMVRVFNRHGDTLLAQLELAAAAGATLDVQNLFRRYTMDSFGDAFFGVELRTLSQPSEFARHFDFLQHAFSWRFRVGPLWKLRGTTKRMRASIDFLHAYFRDLIAEARRDPNLPERTDLLAHYLRSRDEDGAEFSDDYLRDMLINFLLAGRDTTAALLTWLFYRLADHPEVEQRLLDEILTVVGPDADPEPEQLSELRYMKQVLNETLRLSPPVPFNFRTAVKDDVLPNGIFVPAGTDIGYSTYGFQRSTAHWGEDALVFNPDRWTEDRAAQLRSFAFVPFHAGPRICLGQNMAYTEARIALVRILRRYRLAHDPAHRPREVDNIVLTSLNGMPVLVTRR